MTALIWILSIILILFFLTLIKLKVEIAYQDGLTLEISYLFIKFRINFDKKKEKKTKADKKEKNQIAADSQNDERDVDKNQIKDERNFREKISLIMDIADRTFSFSKRLLRYMKKRLTCEKLEVQIQMGSGDAALTAIAVGGLWGFLYSAYAAMTRYFRITFQKPDFQIYPDYSCQNFLFQFRGIFSIRVVNIIVISLWSLFFFLLHLKKKD